MAQLQSNGITGGCLSVQDSISWGNDNAVYCSHYNPVSGDTAITSVCFKYDSTTVELSSFQRAISIFLRPSADFNHYVIATVSGNKKIELITYGWVNTPYPNLSLLHNHWYSYKLSTAFFGAASQVYIKAEVFELGVSGTSSPALVNSSSGTINDNVLAVDTNIEVSITGATYGGCLYMDDFRFYGRKGSSNCVGSTGLENPVINNAINIHYSPVENTLHLNNEGVGSEMIITVFNAKGEKVLESKTSHRRTEINTAALANGLYMMQCKVGNATKNFKFVLSK
jgi:hypothetical protein